MKFLLPRIFYLVARLLHASYRYEFQGREHLDAARRLGGKGYLFAIWHQNLFAGILAQTGQRHTVIVSRSRSGDPVAYTCTRLGHHVARGSSRRSHRDKGGKEARDEMIEMLQTGLPGAVTVDGPNGPPHEVKPGIIDMARRTGIPVVPYLALPVRYWSFRSWDRFRLPKPFTRVRVIYGTPIVVPPDTTFEEFPRYAAAITEALHGLERQLGAPSTASVIRNPGAGETG